MGQQKVIGDWALAVQDTIYVLQQLAVNLDQWQMAGRAEPDDFRDICQQLTEAGLGNWARQAGGHGLEALAQAVGVTADELLAGP